MKISESTKKFLAKTAERVGKTFIEFYLASWLFLSGGSISLSNASLSFDSLFTLANVKAGIVGIALSIGSSLVSKNFGKDKDSPGLV